MRSSAREAICLAGLAASWGRGPGRGIGLAGPPAGTFDMVVKMPRQLNFDPIAEAARQWRTHWGEESSIPMAAVTSVMRAHQLMLAELNAALALTASPSRVMRR